MVDAQVDGVDAVELPGLPEHRLGSAVVVGRVEAEVVVAELRRPVVAPAGQRAGHLAHVVLGVGAAVGAEREQLHHLAGVVLVRVPPAVRRAVEEQQHRRIDRHGLEQIAEAAERHRAEQLVLVEHLLLAVDLVVGVGEPVVPDERHPLDELLVGAHHPIQPPAVIVAPAVGRRERVAVAVGRVRPAQHGRAGRAGLAEHDLRERLTGQRLGLALARAEPGAPLQAADLRDGGACAVHRHWIVGRRRRVGGDDRRGRADRRVDRRVRRRRVAVLAEVLGRVLALVVLALVLLLAPVLLLQRRPLLPGFVLGVLLALQARGSQACGGLRAAGARADRHVANSAERANTCFTRASTGRLS